MSRAMRDEPTERDSWFEVLRHVRERIDHEAVNVDDALRIIDAELSRKDNQ